MTDSTSLPRPGLASSSALGAISLYQKYLSPRKGFSCAHRIRHGGPGCSGYARERIHSDGLWRAIPQIRARFGACNEAALALRETCRCAQSQHDEGNEIDRPQTAEHDEEKARRARRRAWRRERDACCGDCSFPACYSLDGCADLSLGCGSVGRAGAAGAGRKAGPDGCDGCGCDGCDAGGCGPG